MSVIAETFDKSKIVSISPDQSVQAASKLMSEKNVGSVLILKGGRVEGIFTERDLMKSVVAKGLDPNKIKVSEVMSSNVCTVDIGDTVHACYQMMCEKKCRHIPVIEHGKVVRMLTMRDLLHKMMQEVEYENKVLKDYMYSC